MADQANTDSTNNENDDQLYGSAINDTLWGEEGDDTLYGGAGADALWGEEDDDALYGGVGNDYLYGGSGDDKLTGGEGMDTLHGGAGADTFVYGPGDGHDTIKDFGTGADVIDLRGFTGIGSFADLTLRQDGANVVIDLSSHGGGTITLQNFTLANLSADDFLFKGVTLIGDAGDNTLHGGVGDDALSGGAGDDQLYGGAGNDNIYGNQGSDTVYGGAGEDRVLGGANDDTIYGGGDQDYLAGDGGNDQIYGGAGADQIYGGAGDDILSGGADDDELYGGAGADTFVYGPGDGNDMIRGNFSSGGDVIDLRAFTGITSFDDLDLTQSGRSVVIDLSNFGGGKITLQNTFLRHLDGDDFLFTETSVDESAQDGM